MARRLPTFRAMILQIRPFVAPGFGENGYIVWRDGAATAVAIDPGNSVAPMLQLLADEGLQIAAVLLTHAHLDHVEGVARLVGETSAPVYLHPADRFLYDHVAQQAQQFGMRVDPLPDISRPLEHDQQLSIGDVTYRVLHAPGHSPGHVLFHVPDAGCAFVGDVVFQGSIGRSDLPGGDFTQLIESIRAQVLSMPDDTTLYPGHGPPTTVGHERATNPFLIPHYGGGLA
ncbi:MAG TPA: MBL fold metallo-hydrolase [Longimicrobiales bacterium]|nr:MBL fold metallo-hydrolase [Longimicrobiales bacterium]